MVQIMQWWQCPWTSAVHRFWKQSHFIASLIAAVIAEQLRLTDDSVPKSVLKWKHYAFLVTSEADQKLSIW